MKDLLYAILALVSAVISGYFLYSYVSQKGDHGITPFIIAIIFGIGALIFGVLFFLGKVSKREEIHITE